MSEKLRSRIVTLDNDLSLPCVEHGDPEGEPLLLLHGLSDSWRSFEPVLSKFPESVRAIALSQRGHGDADKPLEGYTPRHFANDAVNLLDKLGISRATVAGHSFGSFVAQRIALDHADRVSALILVGSFPAADDNSAVEELWRSVSSMEDPIRRDFAVDFQSSTLAQPIPNALLDVFVGESLKVPARVWKQALRGMMDASHTAILSAIRAPTLIMWGAHDAFFPRSDQDQLLAGIAGAELSLYANAGHAIHWEEPERFAQDVVTFMKPRKARMVC